MSSAVATAAKAAHSLATSLLAPSQIELGADLPASTVLKEESAAETIPLDLQGRNILVGVPGAFTGTCSRQVPGYIELFDQFKKKGIKNIYIIAVNDIFTMKAWKEHLASQGTDVRFIADDQGVFTSAIGLLFDATALLGGPRSKRYVIIAEEGKVSSIAVEESPSNLTVTDAKIILAQL